MQMPGGKADCIVVALISRKIKQLKLEWFYKKNKQKKKNIVHSFLHLQHQRTITDTEKVNL